MYFNGEQLNRPEDIRYKVKDRPHENIVYRYNYHNLQNFSEHQTLDPNLQINMTNSFYKLKNEKTH